MTPEELRTHALKRKAEGTEEMLLTVLRSREPRSDLVRLLGRAGPLGRIVGTSDDGGRVRVAAFFQCDDVLAMLDWQPGVRIR